MTSISVSAEAPQGVMRHLGLSAMIVSFPVMLAGLLVLLSVVTVRSRFDDPDMWWHLKTGEIIWTTHSIPTTDEFSFTAHHHAWVPHEWLSQLCIYGAYRMGGDPALMMWLCCVTSCLLILGYVLCCVYSGNAKVSFLGALLIWLFATSALAIRPQLIGYIFLTLELIVIQLGRTRHPRWFYALPMLFALWVNCHGSFILGLLVALIFLGASLLRIDRGPFASSHWEPRSRIIFTLTSAISVGCLFLNPVGAEQILYPLATMFRMPVSLGAVSEWQALPITEARGLALVGALVSIAMLLIVRGSFLFWHEAILLAVSSWMALNHARMLPVFGIFAAPVLCRMLNNSWDAYDRSRDRFVPNAVLIAASLVGAVLCLPSPQNLISQVNAGSPVRAVEFIKTHHLPGQILNDYEYGGYLIWAAPEYPVFLDGRADIFEWTGVLSEFGQWAALQSDPRYVLDKYKVRVCLLSRNSPMSRVLPLLGWSKVYADSVATVFTR